MGMMLHRHMVQINQAEAETEPKKEPKATEMMIPEGAQEEPKKRGRRAKGE